MSERGLQLWLIGQGIAASPSPAMQRAAMRSRGIRGDYTIVDVDAQGLGEVLARMRRGEAGGANVTIPHKLSVAVACDRLEGDAVLTGAVNTVTVDGGALIGDNTDSAGLADALRAAGLWPSPGCRCVVLGAGGAATAAALAMSRVPAESIDVVARSDGSIAALEARLAGTVRISGHRWNSDVATPLVAGADIVINATPAALEALPFHPRDLPATAIVVDLRYRPRPVDLVRAATVRGLRACDGLEMLLHQGMLSFRLWTGAEPPWAEARAALLAAVKG